MRGRKLILLMVGYQYQPPEFLTQSVHVTIPLLEARQVCQGVQPPYL